MSNNKGNIKLAFETFLKDLQTCEEYQRFKKDAVRIAYEDRIVFSMSAISDIVDVKPIENTNLVEVQKLPPTEFKTTVLKQFEIVINYRVPEINTKENRHLNRKAIKKVNFNIN